MSTSNFGQIQEDGKDVISGTQAATVADAADTTTAPAALTAAAPGAITAASGEASAADLTTTQALQAEVVKIVADNVALRGKLVSLESDLGALTTKFNTVLANLEQFGIQASS